MIRLQANLHCRTAHSSSTLPPKDTKLRQLQTPTKSEVRIFTLNHDDLRPTLMVETDTLVPEEVSTNADVVDLTKAGLETKEVEVTLARTVVVVELLVGAALAKPQTHDRILRTSRNPKTSTSPSPHIRRCTILSCSWTKVYYETKTPMYST